ncbi:MAG: ABC transporter substrate-binding protein, partial [Actinomycetes bacterium]
MTAVVDPSAVTDGTLRLGANYDCDSWDPAAVYIGACWNIQRLMTRTLMAIPRHGDPAGAPAPGAVVPDLATAPGVFNADKTQWTYTIRPGLKFSTGDPLTSADIKYGIERMWATDVLSGGPAQYYLCLLDTCNADGETTYKGPYADPSGGLASITTPDATTITFHLTRPYGDFDHLMALPAS